MKSGYLAALCLAATLLAGAAQAQQNAIPVSVLAAEPTTWTNRIHGIGLLEASQAIDITPSVTGLIVAIEFESGQTVKTGQELVRLETTEQQAQSADARAALVQAEQELTRQRELFDKGVAAKSKYDQAKAAYDRARAQLQNVSASIDRRKILAPFNGLLGIREVKVGDYLQPGTKIVNIQDISSMRVRFLVGQRDFALLKVDQPIQVTVDAYPNQMFAGRIVAIEPSINVRGGVVQVQASLPNPNGMLRSGMFAEINIDLPRQEKQIVLPQSAVAFNLYGESVYLVQDKDGTSIAQVVSVKTGERRDNLVVIEKGVKAGDKVVTEGQLRLQSGAPVRLVPSQAPAPLNPVPLQ